MSTRRRQHCDGSRGHFQLRSRFLLLPLAAWLMAGCGREAPPPAESLRSQLLREACDAMLTGDVRRSRQALERLEAAAEAAPSGAPPSDAFARVARERVEQQARLAEINGALRAGRVEDAAVLVREATGPGFKAAAQAAPAVEALLVLQGYLRKRPFATSDEAEVALRAFTEEHRRLLDASPAFREFLDQQNAELAAMRRREEITVVDWLVAELDTTAVEGGPHAAERLAHLAALRPEHDVVRTWAAAVGSDVRALNRLSSLTAGGPASRRAFEVGICLAWHQMSAAAWEVVAPPLALGPPASLSGQLLKAAAAAEVGQYDEAVRNLHDLASQSAIDRGHVELLLRRYVVGPGQAEAWCWRTPGPGVADILACILQLRTSRVR